MALQNFHLSPLYVQIEDWYKLSGVEGDRGNFSSVSGLVVFVCVVQMLIRKQAKGAEVPIRQQMA